MQMSGSKVIVSAVLVFLLVGVAIWAVTQSVSESDTPQVRYARVLPRRAGFEVEFTRPVTLGTVAVEAAATLSPEVEGTWVQVSPHELRFLSTDRLPGSSRYTLTLSDELAIEGEREFSIDTTTFSLREITFDEEAGTTPGTALISARLEFNDDVSPEDLAKHATLVNESTGQQVALQVLDSWRSQYMEVQSEPVKKTPQGATYRLTISRGMTPTGEVVALKEDVSATMLLQLDPVLHFKQLTVGQAVQLAFSTPVPADGAKDFLSITPPVDHSIVTDGSSLLLSGEFQPGQRYDITLREGLVAADGAVLEQAETIPVQMPDLDPAVSFVGSGMFLPRSRVAGLVLEAVNTSGVDVSLDRVYPNNLFSMLRDHGWKVFDQGLDYYPYVPDSLGGRLYEERIPVNGTRNQPVRLPLTLGEKLTPGERGLFKINASLPGQYGTMRWLLLTDIGLVAKRDANEFRVWAVSHATLKPLAGVRLTLVSDKNQDVAQVMTSANGAARLPLPKDDADGQPYMILAEKGDDFSFLLPSRFGVDYAGLDVSGVVAPPSGTRGFLYGERDLYRPGETLKGVAVVRQSDLSPPHSMPLVLKRFDPRGRELASVRLMTGADGVVDFELPIPAHALTGGHALIAEVGGEVIGSYDYKVEEFIPDRIKVEVKTTQNTYAPGEQVQADIQSHYLFGPAAANLPVTVRARLQAAPFTAKGFEHYVFGNPNRTFEPQDIFHIDTELDEQGAMAVSIDLPGGLQPPAALEAFVFGRVSETGGRGVTARKRVVVHPYAHYLGLKRLEKLGYTPGQPMTFDYVSVDRDGSVVAPSAAMGLTARLYKNRYRSVLRQTPSGGYTYESVNDPTMIAQQDISTGTGTGSVTFTPPTYGSYQMELLSPESGASTVVDFYCGGWGYSPWAMENPARVELVPDKDQYRAGETATIQIRAPFSGRMLVAVEGETIRDTKVIDLAGNTGEVRFPVYSSYAPNVHVTAMLLRKGADVGEGAVARAFGAVPLLVDNLSNKMDLRVSGPDEVRPESEVTVTVQAEPGAVVTLAAVDEGIMQLSGTSDPGPFDFFYARRALMVESFDTFSMLYPDFRRLMNAARAGGGMAMEAESQFMRTEGIRRVKPVAFWSGLLRAGADGSIRHTLQLPDFQGALRVVAVGMDGKRFGTTRTMIRVRSPLAVTPTLPRFLATGDQIEMPVTVRNDTGRAGEITVTVQASGAVQSIASPVTLTLEEAQEETIYVPIAAQAGAGGPASITVLASGNGEERRVKVDLPVRPALPYQRDMAFGVMNGENENDGEMVPAPEGVVDGTVTRTVALGSQPMTRFAGQLDALLQYPYGCAEQTTSKAFPLIRFGAVAATLAPHLVEQGDAPARVQAAINRLGSMQTGNGGFAYWPGGDDAHPWVSCYVTHFLLEARQAGYGTPWMLEGALSYMSQLLRSHDAPAVRAYALFNLATAGRAERGFMDELRDKQSNTLDAASLTLLACGYAQVGDMDSFSRLTGLLGKVKPYRAANGGMQSGLSDSALMLLTLADVDMTDPLVPELSQQVSSFMATNQWGTTYENGVAFAALGKVLENAPSEPFSGELVIGETAMPFTDVHAFNQDGVAMNGPVRARLSKGGPVYWSVTTRAVPELEAFKPVTSGIELRRSFLGRDGEPVDVSQLEQGALVLMKTELRAQNGPLENVVLQVLLPAGLEVENPRLDTTELGFELAADERLIAGHQDLRDDRVLFFTDLPGDAWSAGYTQLRAVTPGRYTLPPVQAEAMYHPEIIGVGEVSTMNVVKKP